MPNARHRIASTLPVAVSSGSGGGGTTNIPTADWAEDASAADDFRIQPILADDVSVEDAFAYLIAKEGEDASVDDALRVPILSSGFAEDTSANDRLWLTLNDVDCARTGTPDSDLMFDAWVDQLTAQVNINHGNESLQVKGKSTAASDEKQAWVGIDFTWLSGWVGSDNFGMRYTFTASTSSLALATTVTWGMYNYGSKPFTESTLTWNNKPALSGLNTTGTISVAAGAAQQFSIDCTTSFQNFHGNWMLILFTCASTLLPDTVTILSRDNATAANRPKFTIDRSSRSLT